jgi:hypothetical protein
MDIRLIRRPHPNRMVRSSGITPTDPYLEWCWLPVVGPSTVALVRHVADLTADSGEARLPMGELSRLLGLGRVADTPGRNNKLVRTIVRAEQFGLGFTSLGVAEGATVGIHDHVALVPARLLERLPEVAWQRHVAAVEAANKTLTAARLPASDRPSPALTGRLSASGPPRRPNPRRRSRSGHFTRSRRSPASTPKPRLRRRRPSSRCDADATTHDSRHERPTHSRRTH